MKLMQDAAEAKVELFQACFNLTSIKAMMLEAQALVERQAEDLIGDSDFQAAMDKIGTLRMTNLMASLDEGLAAEACESLQYLGTKLMGAISCWSKGRCSEAWPKIEVLLLCMLDIIGHSSAIFMNETVAQLGIFVANLSSAADTLTDTTALRRGTGVWAENLQACAKKAHTIMMEAVPMLKRTKTARANFAQMCDQASNFNKLDSRFSSSLRINFVPELKLQEDLEKYFMTYIIGLFSICSFLLAPAPGQLDAHDSWKSFMSSYPVLDGTLDVEKIEPFMEGGNFLFHVLVAAESVQALRMVPDIQDSFAQQASRAHFEDAQMKNFLVGLSVGRLSDLVRAEMLGVANAVVEEFVGKIGVREVILSDIATIDSMHCSTVFKFLFSGDAGLLVQHATQHLMLKNFVPAQIVAMPLMSAPASCIEHIVATIAGPDSTHCAALQRGGTDTPPLPTTVTTSLVKVYGALHIVLVCGAWVNKMLNDKDLFVTPDASLSMAKSAKGEALPDLGLKRDVVQSLSALRAAIGDLNDKMSDSMLASVELGSLNLRLPLASCKQFVGCLLSWATKSQNFVLEASTKMLQDTSEKLESFIPRYESAFSADGNIDIVYARQRILGCPKKATIKPHVRFLRAIVTNIAAAIKEWACETSAYAQSTTTYVAQTCKLAENYLILCAALNVLLVDRPAPTAGKQAAEVLSIATKGTTTIPDSIIQKLQRLANGDPTAIISAANPVATIAPAPLVAPEPPAAPARSASASASSTTTATVKTEPNEQPPRRKKRVGLAGLAAATAADTVKRPRGTT